jgi:hypothetical protein
MQSLKRGNMHVVHNRTRATGGRFGIICSGLGEAALRIIIVLPPNNKRRRSTRVAVAWRAYPVMDDAKLIMYLVQLCVDRESIRSETPNWVQRITKHAAEDFKEDMS